MPRKLLYNGVNIEEKRIICKCNLNINSKKEEEEEKEEKEDNGNFISYLLDNINYKIFQCYHLLSKIKNLTHNYAFFVIAGVSLVLLIIDILYFCYIIPKIICSILREAPTPQRVREDTRKELIRIKNLNRFNIIKEPPRKKKYNETKTIIKKTENKYYKHKRYFKKN